MRDQLIQYVNLLFAGVPDAYEIKEEILQNTLDRYDDLIAQGKFPQAAYSLAISGIGDINEILGSSPVPTAVAAPVQPKAEDTSLNQILRAVAIGLYILAAIPLFVLSELGMDTLGLCGTVAIVAVATVLLLICKKKGSTGNEREREEKSSPKNELRKGVRTVISWTGVCIYLGVSFWSQAWYITWLVFPIVACVEGLVIAIMDLKEASKYEN